MEGHIWLWIRFARIIPPFALMGPQGHLVVLHHGKLVRFSEAKPKKCGSSLRLGPPGGSRTHASSHSAPNNTAKLLSAPTRSGFCITFYSREAGFSWDSLHSPVLHILRWQLFVHIQLSVGSRESHWFFCLRVVRRKWWLLSLLYVGVETRIAHILEESPPMALPSPISRKLL